MTALSQYGLKLVSEDWRRHFLVKSLAALLGPYTSLFGHAYSSSKGTIRVTTTETCNRKYPDGGKFAKAAPHTASRAIWRMAEAGHLRGVADRYPARFQSAKPGRSSGRGTDRSGVLMEERSIRGGRGRGRGRQAANGEINCDNGGELRELTRSRLNRPSTAIKRP